MYYSHCEFISIALCLQLKKISIFLCVWKSPVLCTFKSRSLSISSSLKNHQSLCSFLELESIDLVLLNVYSGKKFAHFSAFIISLVFTGIKYLQTANSGVLHVSQVWIAAFCTEQTLHTSRFHLLFLIQATAINYIIYFTIKYNPPICAVKMGSKNCEEYRTTEN